MKGQERDEAKNAAAPDAQFLKKVRSIEIRARRMVDSLFSGEYHSAFKGRGMEYAESRPYHPGDDIRAMDWNVTARAGAPFVKTFREERELTIMLLYDLSASGFFGSGGKLKSETAAEVLATLAFSAIRNNDKVGLAAFTDRVELYIPPRKGRKNVLRLIREILFLEPRGRGTDIALALDYLGAVMKKRAIVFLVSDFLAEGYERRLKSAARACDLVAVRLADPREMDLPDAGRVALRDAETGLAVTVNTSCAALREEYRRAAQAEDKRRAMMFTAAGVDEVVIHPDRPYTGPLIRFFKARERRAGLR